jgi:hypothetical protein
MGLISPSDINQKGVEKQNNALWMNITKNCETQD